MSDCCRLASILAPRGYLVIKCAPGEPYCCVSFANDHSDRIGAGWQASWNPEGGFTEREALAVAQDRGGGVAA